MNLPPDIKVVLDESYEQRFKVAKKVIELPCKNLHKYKEPVMVQISQTGDQKIVCPKCGKAHYLTWSKIQDHLKWSQ